MYRLMIVDDDEVICRGLASSTDWGSMGVELAGTAFNALQALEQMRTRPVDICITDICMPVMDGLELAYVIGEEFPGTKIILLSAFSEFEYAQKAVRLGVFEYLTKPFTKQEVRDTVSLVVAALDAEKRQMSRFSPLVAELLLQQLLSAQSEDDKLVKHAGGILGIGDEQWYRVIVLALFPSGGRQDEERMLHFAVESKNRLDQVRSALPQDAWRASMPLGGMAVVVRETDAQSRVAADEAVACCVRVLTGPGSLCSHIGVSAAAQGGTALADALRETRKAMSRVEGTPPNGEIVYVEEQREDLDDLLRLELPKERVESYIRQYRYAELVHDLYGLFRHMDARKYSLLRMQAVAMELLLTIMRAVERDSVYDSALPGFQEAMSAVLQSQDSQAIHAGIQILVSELYRIFENYRQSSIQPLIESLCAYIREHFDEADLTSKAVAKSAHISTSYLAYLFRKRLSCSFGAYLTQVRMEEAMKILISTNAKTYEVSDMVGYSSPQYFNNSFKKYTGLTPGEYRLKTAALETSI